MARSSDCVSPAQKELMRQCGRVLVGGAFNPVLALGDMLRVNQRSMQRWFSGQNAVPPGLWREILGLVEEREREVEHLRRAIEAELAESE